MTTSTLTYPFTQSAAGGLAPRLLTAALFITTAVLSFLPISILGPAIGWPASLRAPAAEQLTAIAAAPVAVAAGYGVYLLYSILLLPVMVLLAHRVCGRLWRPAAAVVVGFAVLSVLARSIGILRWLTVMPALARQHAGESAANRQTIDIIFSAVSTYGGGIGELLGVSLFMGLSLGLAMLAALAYQTLPRWLCVFGLICAAMLLSLFLPALGLALHMPIALAATALSAWMLAAGVVLGFRPRSNV
jgi:Domain of unknown function (DUF4386)